MSEERAFLDALDASPADDTTRLVYADWLDDHGEPAKAAYLRAVVGLVPALHTAADEADAKHVSDLAATLPSDWRMAAAARFMVVLYGFDPSKKIRTIKAVRELTGFGLGEAKKFVESLPSRFPLRTTLEGALGLREHLRSTAECNVGVHPCDVPELPRMATYTAIAELYDWTSFDNPEYSPDPQPEAVKAFQDFLTAALGISREEAAGLTDHRVELAAGLEPAAVESRMQELRALLPPPDPSRSWEIALYSYYELSPAPSP